MISHPAKVVPDATPVLCMKLDVNGADFPVLQQWFGSLQRRYFKPFNVELPQIHFVDLTLSQEVV
jgi:hypothetical protein